MSMAFVIRAHLCSDNIGLLDQYLISLSMFSSTALLVASVARRPSLAVFSFGHLQHLITQTLGHHTRWTASSLGFTSNSCNSSFTSGATLESRQPQLQVLARSVAIFSCSMRTLVSAASRARAFENSPLHLSLSLSLSHHPCVSAGFLFPCSSPASLFCWCCSPARPPGAVLLSCSSVRLIKTARSFCSCSSFLQSSSS